MREPGKNRGRRIQIGAAFGALMVVVTLVIWLYPEFRSRSKYEHWVQGNDWRDPSLSLSENVSTRLAALDGVTEKMVCFCIEDLEEKEPLKDRIIARLPEVIRRHLPEPRQFRPRKYAAMNYLRDLGPRGSNATPAVIKCLSGSGINQSMFAAWTLGKIGSGQPQVIHALESVTNLTEISVHVMAAYSLWRQNSNRVDALAIIDRGLRDGKTANDAATLNVMYAMVQLGKRGRQFAPSLRYCLTNSKSGRESDVLLRAQAAHALWRVERSADGLGPFFEVVTNLPPSKQSPDTVTTVGVQLRRLKEGIGRNLSEVPGFNVGVRQILSDLESSASEPERARIREMRRAIKGRPVP